MIVLFRVILYSSTLLTTAQGTQTTDLTEEYTVQSSSNMAQSTSSKSMITTREPDQEPSADQPETNAMAQNTQDTMAKDTTAQNITSTLDALHLDPPITPPETVEFLRAYEKKPDEAQKYLGTTNLLYTRLLLLLYTLFP